MIDPEDVATATILGLMDAIDAYQPGQHEDIEGFEDFAAPYVWDSIVGELTADDWKVVLVRVDRMEDGG